MLIIGFNIIDHGLQIRDIGNINLIADQDDILTVSQEINGYGGKNGIPNGFNDRKLFNQLLKKIFNYDKCKNKK